MLYARPLILRLMPNSSESDPAPGPRPYDREAYKQSKWAFLIGVAYQYIVKEALENRLQLSPQTERLADWADWMVQEGYKLPDEQICQNLVEIGLTPGNTAKHED